LFFTIALSDADARHFFLDPKVLNRALFGAWYEEDIYDKCCAVLPAAMRALWWRIPAAMRARGLIFVHVPRVAGTSIVRALYGEGCIHHHSMRYYRSIDPGFAQNAASFALLRDPFDRFASAYAFVRAGGTSSSRLSEVFVRQTSHVITVDDYLCFLEERGPLDLDFVMRPQSWFVCDPATGAALVKDLFLLGEDAAALACYLAPQKIGPLPWLNRSPRLPLLLGARQRRRIECLYADDFALIDSVRSVRRTQDMFRSAAIAAE
jgi:Sulfotransferase family